MDPKEAMGNEPVIDTPETEPAPVEQPYQPEAQAGAAAGQDAAEESVGAAAGQDAAEESVGAAVGQDAAEESVGAYHGAGVGQKESPYAQSPYYTAYQTRQADYTGPAWEQEPGHQAQEAPGASTYQSPYASQPRSPKPKKERKPLSRKSKAVIAAVLAVVLVVGSCGVTAGMVNAHWENEVDELQNEMQTELAQLQEQLKKVSSISAGTSVSGSPMAAEGALTPSQVYAMNVNCVVAISNYAVVSGGWGGSASEVLASTGSGFIISEDGYVITNYHVAEGANRITVTTYTGEEYEAQLVGHDELNDVALLKMDAAGLDAVTIGSSEELIIGDMVVAIGNPLGELTSTQTVGYVSGKDRSVSTDGAIINMLQTDAAINSGNSGGPLFNMKGEVVGITTAKYSGPSASGATIEGIGFAIPIDDVMSMIGDLREYGYLKNQAYLGVSVMDMDATTAAMYSLPVGSYVESVVEGGSAHRAGVQPKDIIIAVGEHEISGNSELTSALRRFSAGESSTITVFRSGQEVVLDITFDEKPQNLEAESTTPSVPGEMPESGSYEEWYNFFAPFFGN